MLRAMETQNLVCPAVNTRESQNPNSTSDVLNKYDVNFVNTATNNELNT